MFIDSNPYQLNWISYSHASGCVIKTRKRVDVLLDKKRNLCAKFLHSAWQMKGPGQ